MDKREQTGEQGKCPRRFIVTEMPKEWPVDTIHEVTGWFRRGFRGECEAPNSWRIVNLVFLWKSDASAEKGVRRPSSYCAVVSDCEVVFFGFGGDAE